MVFKLTIRLGADAMQTPEDVAYALRKLTDELSIVWSDIWPSDTSQNLRDVNGNTVGSWELTS